MDGGRFLYLYAGQPDGGHFLPLYGRLWKDASLGDFLRGYASSAVSAASMCLWYQLYGDCVVHANCLPWGCEFAMDGSFTGTAMCSGARVLPALDVVRLVALHSHLLPAPL